MLVLKHIFLNKYILFNKYIKILNIILSDNVRLGC